MTVDVRLNAILDPERAGGRPLVDLARAVVAGGATLLQLRDKHGSTRRMIEEARALIEVLAPLGVPLVINDRVDVALAAGAAGVHVGPDDMAVEDARAILGPGAIVGHSIKTLDQAERVPLDLLDYAGVGGVYATLSKDNPAPPMGPEGLAKIRAVLRRRAPLMPVVGIAGIEIGNAAPVVAAGADGVAVISALSLAPDPEVAARTLRAIVDGALAERAA
ncbi:thiamine phosphate synthase [Rhodoplanes sp. SY1]|uniref:thiamine phosphate synthase n=1 Tax=Rhodoplanes sp. SY1 TaxID=3166646 RepID=UPI0038B5A3BF